MENETSKQYTNGEVTIVWKSSLCIHSKNCWREGSGLPEVFNPRVKPWINPEAASTDRIVEQIKKCPSGALDYFFNNKSVETSTEDPETKIEVVRNGPLLVYGNIHLQDQNLGELKKSNVTAFCRCGKSENKPFCDGSHNKHNFTG